MCGFQKISPVGFKSKVLTIFFCLFFSHQLNLQIRIGRGPIIPKETSPSNDSPTLNGRGYISDFLKKTTTWRFSRGAERGGGQDPISHPGSAHDLCSTLIHIDLFLFSFIQLIYGPSLKQKAFQTKI